MDCSHDLEKFRFTEGLFETSSKRELKQVLQRWVQIAKCVVEIEGWFFWKLASLLQEEVKNLDKLYYVKFTRLHGHFVSFYYKEEIECAEQFVFRLDLSDMPDTFPSHKCILKVRHFLTDFVGRIFAINSGSFHCLLQEQCNGSAVRKLCA